MSDADGRIPEEAKDGLAAGVAAAGPSLRACPVRRAETMLTPAERAERAEKARAALRAWNGYAPSAAGQSELDDELDRRIARVRRP